MDVEAAVVSKDVDNVEQQKKALIRAEHEEHEEKEPRKFKVDAPCDLPQNYVLTVHLKPPSSPDEIVHVKVPAGGVSRGDREDVG